MTKPEFTDTALRDRAVKQLKKRRDFTTHLLFYLLVNASVVVLWFLTGADGFFWPGVLMAFWAIGVVMNAWDVWHGEPFSEQQICDEMTRQRGLRP